MEPADFSPPPRDTPEQDPPPARTEDQSRERVSAYDLMVVDDVLEGLNKKKEDMRTILDQIHEKASSVLEFSLKWEKELEERDKEIELKQREMEERKRSRFESESSLLAERGTDADQKKEDMRTIFDQIQEKASSALELSLKWEEIDEQFGFLKQRTLEAELKEASLRKQTLELEKKEERLKLVQEREMKIEASLIERMSALEEKENESDLKFLEADVMRLVLQMQNEQVVVAQLNAQEVMRELEASKKEVSLLSKSVDDKSCDLEMKVRDFDLKQTAETERRRREAEVMETSLKQLEARKNELSLLNDTIKEKSTELEKKEETFLLKSKVLDLKEKELEEMEERVQVETRKRSRLESEPSSLAEKGTDADQSLIRPGKKPKPISTQNNHYDEDKEKDSAFVSPASTSSPVQISEAHEGDIEEAVSIDDNDEDHEPLRCVDSEFNDFSKTMSSFMVGQVWALYDPIDKMPRYYAQIKGILEHQLSLWVKWLEPVGTSENKKPNPACGRFKYGKSGTNRQLMFSHEMSYTIRFGKIVSINPRKGEIWALFRDWTKTWNVHREQHKTPYRYDFVEVLSEFDKNQGIGVAYLGKVEGFTSVYKLAEINGFVKRMIASDEMLRFSHRVPSVKMTGDEKEGVPAGSFELDPAAVPLDCLKSC